MSFSWLWREFTKRTKQRKLRPVVYASVQNQNDSAEIRLGMPDTRRREEPEISGEPPPHCMPGRNPTLTASDGASPSSYAHLYAGMSGLPQPCNCGFAFFLRWMGAATSCGRSFCEEAEGNQHRLGCGHAPRERGNLLPSRSRLQMTGLRLVRLMRTSAYGKKDGPATI